MLLAFEDVREHEESKELELMAGVATAKRAMG
jgi:hypothetical protein